MNGATDPPPHRALLEARNLTMRYGRNTAVNRVSFSVDKGTTVGFLGANGAGKSTTMRLLTGFYTPTAGTVTVDGHDVVRHRRLAQAKIGYLPEAAGGLGHLNTTEFLAYCCEARGLSGAQRQRAITQVCAELELASVMTTRMQRLSKGWRQRVWLAQALIHNPEVLILDEPTDGLDPLQKHAIRQLILRLAATKAIILSTHILEEAEEICERAIIIHHGAIVADQPVAELVDSQGRLTDAFHRLTG